MANPASLDKTPRQLITVQPADANKENPLGMLPVEVIMNIFDQMRNSPKDCAHLEMTCRAILIISRDTHSTHWKIYPQYFFAIHDAINLSWALQSYDPQPQAIEAAEKALMEEEVGALTVDFLNTLLITKDDAALTQEFYSSLKQARNKRGFDQSDRLMKVCQVAFHQIVIKSAEKLRASKSPLPSPEQINGFNKYVHEITLKESIDAFMSQPLDRITRESFKKKRDFLTKAHFLNDTEVEIKLRKSFQVHHTLEEGEALLSVIWNRPFVANSPFFLALKERIKQKLTNEKDRLKKELGLLRGPNGFDGKINEMYWRSVEEQKQSRWEIESYRAHSHLVSRLRDIAVFDDSGALIAGRIHEIENDLDDHVIEYRARIERLKLLQFFHELFRHNNADEYENWGKETRHSSLEKILEDIEE